MRKEVILAILAGISIGLFFAFGVYKFTKKVKSRPISLVRQETPRPQNITALSINNLYNFDVITKNPFIISGTAEPNLNIIASTVDEDYYTKAKEDGSFEVEIDVPAGLGEIKINDEKLTVVYSTEVEEKSTSYVGSITDISAGTIQLKGGNGEILQASTNTETTYTNLLKKITEIKESDLAIGDYVAVLGAVNGNKVLKAQRVLITSPIPENKIEVQEITIETLSKTKIISSGDVNDITLPKTWKGPNVSALEEGQSIIVVGIRNGEKFDLRSIFVIE